MPPQVSHNQLLATQFVGLFDASRQYRVTLGGVGADNHDQTCLSNIGDRAGVAAITHRPEQALGGRRLAIARAVIDVMRANDRRAQFLHQVTLLVCTFGRGDKAQ